MIRERRHLISKKYKTKQKLQKQKLTGSHGHRTF